MVLAGVARFGRSFSTSLADCWKVGVYMSNALECSCGGKFNAFVENGAIQSKPIQGVMRGVVGQTSSLHYYYVAFIVLTYY
jgi:hypothetical protein